MPKRKRSYKRKNTRKHTKRVYTFGPYAKGLDRELISLGFE